jgi:ribulose-phosphate 3-epimerase
MQRTGREILLEIDGGVKESNIAEIAAAGADTFVAGSAIFGQGDYAARIAGLRARLAGAHADVPPAAAAAPKLVR